MREKIKIKKKKGGRKGSGKREKNHSGGIQYIQIRLLSPEKSLAHKRMEQNTADSSSH